MGFCLNGHPCQPRWLLIPMVRAWQNLYGPMSAVSSLAPSLRAFIVKGDRKMIMNIPVKTGIQLGAQAHPMF